MLNKITKQLVQLAIEEDIGSGDITTDNLVSTSQNGIAEIVAKSNLIVCGHEVAKYCLSLVDSDVNYIIEQKDGTQLAAKEKIATLKGAISSILKAERTILNFLQRLSGISTFTSELVLLINGTGSKILDTRKTTPGWRELEKYAVKVGGGLNHRFGLFDQVLIKNNHIDAMQGNIEAALQKIKSLNLNVKVEIEVRNLAELLLAVKYKPDMILLDNMTVEEITRALKEVRDYRSQIKFEASGNITKENLLSYAKTGVDFISMGALTHSVKAADISLYYLKL